MRHGWWIVGTYLSLCGQPVALAAPAVDDGELADQVACRVLLGLKDKEPTVWEGKVSVNPGRLVRIDGWDFSGQDRAAADGTFRFSTHPAKLRPGQRPGAAAAAPVANGLIVTAAGVTADSKLTVAVGQFTVEVPLATLATGRFQAQQGQVQVESGAAAAHLTGGRSAYEDFPASAVGADGSLWVAYTAFTPAERWRERGKLESAPERFGDYRVPAQGDQVLLLRRQGGTWGEPLPVSPAGLDAFRPAVAVDGQGVVWVVWSQNTGCDANFENGDFELWACAVRDGRAGEPQRLTTAPGADTFVTAATDAAGRVWLAWMGFRENDARILVRRQEGAGFGPEETVGNSPRDEWLPALATASDGAVAVVWDSYAKGDYDVWARIWRDGRWAEALPVSRETTGEMNASAVFDRAGRLWVSYELSPANWAKDDGPLDRTGRTVPIFAGRRGAVRVVEGDTVKEPVEPLTAATLKLVPENAAPQAKNSVQALSLPRLALDGQGRVWCAYRLKFPDQRANVGPVWHTYATCYSGGAWTRPLWVTGSDANQEYRPQFVPTRAGQLLMLCSTDYRLFNNRVYPNAPPVQNDLWQAYLRSAAPVTEPQLQAVAPPPQVTAPPDPEPADIARMRAARWTVGGQTWRVLRGEFHRHTELSPDGGGDGTWLDMWRYALDAADLDWVGFGDHDNGNGREYSWWISQKSTQMFLHAPRFVPLFTYERSANYPDGHRNVVFAQRGVRTLARLNGGLGKDLDDQPDAPRPHTPDTQMLYRYLKEWNGICASHTSGTDMGTDWRDNDPAVEPVVEIYQGDRNNYEAPGAPRSASGPDNSYGGWRPNGFVSLALLKGYRLGFQASSDHLSTHISYCNLLVREPTRAALLEAFQQRRCYGSTDNIVGHFRCSADGREYLLGQEITIRGNPRLQWRIAAGAPVAKVVLIRDNEVLYTATPNEATVDLQYEDQQPKRGQTAYYYVRGELANGELIWLSPIWVKAG
ncbi:MAG: hypothetical protein IT204_06555 [Fimbriimonadaceae bacterium]|nr:hypothetical protein [Fimbriimonadaceae bacterium]